MSITSTGNAAEVTENVSSYASPAPTICPAPRVKQGSKHRSSPFPHPAFPSSGVTFNDVIRLRILRSTSKRKPWKVKTWPIWGLRAPRG